MYYIYVVYLSELRSNIIMKIFDLIRVGVITVVLSAMFVGAFAQTGVSINSAGTAPNADAILDINSTTKGVLLPRMTTGDASTLALSLDAGDDGMIIYNQTVKAFRYWDGALLAWQTLITSPGLNNTLDQAYDQNGAGAGRIIVADAGNVEIQGAGSLTIAGNVGIGTTAPDRRIKISGTGWTALEVENTDNQAAALELTSQGVSNYVYTDASGFLGLESATGEDVIVRTDGGAERMRIAANGNVAVGNSTAAYKLHVSGDIYADGGWMRVSGNNGLSFESYGTGIHSVTASGGVSGSVSTYGNEGGWEGYSINGRHVFMGTPSGNDCGIYNDVNNEWMIRAFDNDRVELYYDNLTKLQTTNTGVIVNGKILSDGISEISDIRFKIAIAPIDDALSSILKMNGVTYDWRRDEFPDKNFTETKQYGLIAQEIEQIIPELVNTDVEGWKSIQYTHLMPVLIEALKEQQQIIDSQKQDITNLELKADANASQIEAILQQLNGYTTK
ncbi:MAG: hypothetical protein ACI9UR_000852 [Bacteroidia bacterium]